MVGPLQDVAVDLALLGQVVTTNSLWPLAQDEDQTAPWDLVAGLSPGLPDGRADRGVGETRGHANQDSKAGLCNSNGKQKVRIVIQPLAGLFKYNLG